MKSQFIASVGLIFLLTACSSPTPTQVPTVAPKPAEPTKPAAPVATLASTATPTAAPKLAEPTKTVAIKKLKLMASTALVRDTLLNLTKNIEGITVETIVPLGADPHEFEPTPKDVKALADSQAVFIIGAEFEHEWLDKLIKNAGGKRPVVDLSAGIRLNKADAQFASELAYDPHYWQNPEYWQKAVLNAARGVVSLDANLGEFVNKNAEDYIAKIKSTDAAIKAEVEKIPPNKRVLVTTHDAFGYYAQRYGFNVVGTVIPGASTAQGAVNPRNIKTMVDTIKRLGVKAIFVEEGVNPKLTEAVAKEAGITVIEKLYLDTLSDDKGPAATYLDMLNHNTATIVGALK
jgi:ABC-type Zn uptake system ZnuABC Zn-binding protein ZnuA